MRYAGGCGDVVVRALHGEVARAREAVGRPTLGLLEGKWAPFVLAVFRSSLSHVRRSIPAELLHVQEETYLTELR